MSNNIFNDPYSDLSNMDSLKPVSPEPEPAPIPSNSMLEKKYHDVYSRWKAAPNPHTNTELIKALNPVIDRAVQTYAVGTPSPNVRNKARVMAIQALNKYDPSRQKLDNYLYYQLQGLRRVSAKDQEIIQIPERVRLDSYRLDAIENELRDELGRQPTPDELADRSGLSLKRITHINKGRYGQQSEGYYLSELEGDEDSPLAPEVEQPESYDNLIKFMYDDLDPINKQILAYSTGMFGYPKLSNSKIAQKLGVTPGAITQRMNRIYSMLQELQKAELGI